MPVSSPFSSSAPNSAGASDFDFATALLIVIGTGLFLLTIVIVIGGGFVIHIGDLSVSLHRWPRPLAIGAAAWLIAVARGRARVSAFLIRLTQAIERRTAMVAVVLAACAAGSGIAFGTYAAAGSDAAGYIGEAQLFLSGRLSFDAPLARRVHWPAAEASFSPLGFRPAGAPGRIVPTYPPGLPLAMLPAIAAFGEFGAYLVVPLLGAVAVLCTYALGRRIQSPIAGVMAAALMATSPIFLFEIAQPMSDVAATAWWALALWLAWDASPRRAAFAGIAAGCAFLTRPNLLPLVVPLGIGLVWSSARGRRAQMVRLIAALTLALAPFGAALAALQARMYGSALESGYGPGAWHDFFALENIGQNISDYMNRLLVNERAAVIVAAVAILALLSRRHLHANRDSLRAAAIAMSFFVTIILCYLPYGVFPDWWYLRFLLPAFPALFAAVATVAAVALLRLPAAAGGVILVMAITAAAASNIAQAQKRQVFLARGGEARYQLTGRYLAAMLPSNAVIVTSQESASVHDYAHVPIVRWDDLRVDLDAAVAQLTTLGYRPLLLVEDWEQRDLAKRFPASSLTRLDWMPIADFGDPVRVGLFDPVNRETKATDRVH